MLAALSPDPHAPRLLVIREKPVSIASALPRCTATAMSERVGDGSGRHERRRSDEHGRGLSADEVNWMGARVRLRASYQPVWLIELCVRRLLLLLLLLLQLELL